MGLRFVALAALSMGCFIKPDRPGGTTGDGGPTGSCVMPAQNGFDDATPCAPWGQVIGSPNRMVAQSNGALTVTPPPSIQSTGGCSSRNAFGFDSGVFVAVDHVVDGTTAGTNFDITDSVMGTIHLQVTSGTIIFFDDNGSPPMTTPYVQSQMRWWRFRPLRAIPELVAEVSADFTSWSPVGTLPGLPSTTVTVSMYAHEDSTTVAAPGFATFRSFDVCP